VKREIVNSKRVTPYRHPISHAVKAGDLVFLSGITPFKGDRELAVGDFCAQMHQVMRNVSAILEDAGSSLNMAAKMTVVLARMSDFTEMNEIYSSYFEPGNYPARLTIQSPVPGKDFLVEIDCVAALKG
jgi:2-iminobutanoate/2-iminopropanoate deaminase